jgi:hypothetical protein
MMLGSAMRRFLVKNSARPQAVAATKKPAKGEGRAVVIRPIDWPIQATANSRIARMPTKMSLKR